MNVPQHVINTQIYLCLHPPAPPALQRVAEELGLGREGRKEGWEGKLCCSGSSAAAQNHALQTWGKAGPLLFLLLAGKYTKCIYCVFVIHLCLTCETYPGALGLLVLLKG